MTDRARVTGCRINADDDESGDDDDVADDHDDDGYES